MIRRRRSRRRRSAVLVGIGWAAMALSVVAFLAESGLGRFSNLGSSLTAVGIIAGLIATNALLLMLLLAARVPFVDRTLGQPKATALHSQLGNWVVVGLGVHLAFVLVGYSLMDAFSWIDEFAYLWNYSTDFILAVSGMALLLVVVSSIAAARRRLPYEAWHAIHLASYVAVGLSIPHMFSMSGLLAQGAWQRAYWIALLVVTGAALLVFRVVVPVVTSLRHQLRVVGVTPEGFDGLTIEITGRRLDRLRAQPGQYLHWRFLAKGLWWHQHPFSLSAAPRPDRLRITVRALGDGTAALGGLLPGTRVAVEGPYGDFTESSRTSAHVTLVGAGIGIAPIRALVEELSVEGQATVILRASDAGELYLADEIRHLCGVRGVELITLIGPRAADGWMPADRAGLTLQQLAPQVIEGDLYVCGPSGFTDAVLAEARALGVDEERLHAEAFAW